MLPLEPGSIVICSFVENLVDLKEGKTYIVVSKSQGLVYKRVRTSTKKKSLILVSDNDLYLPYEMQFDEIQEIWQYYAHLSFSDSIAVFRDMMQEKINDIQRKVTAINKKLDSG